ncbi:MAG: hypothetical protein KC917_21650, partial [Candidatus Omnitrophica bacterium]|nr:hypothetical protein [Candidatus Omnitrophota bacterium]
LKFPSNFESQVHQLNTMQSQNRFPQRFFGSPVALFFPTLRSRPSANVKAQGMAALADIPCRYLLDLFVIEAHQ